MDIINVKSFKKERMVGESLLRVVQNKLTMSKGAVAVLGIGDECKGVDVEFGMMDGTLHIRSVSLPTETSVEFKCQANKQFELYNKGFSDHLKEMSGSTLNTIPMKILEAKDPEGWHVVITSYWKTLQK